MRQVGESSSRDVPQRLHSNARGRVKLGVRVLAVVVSVCVVILSSLMPWHLKRTLGIVGGFHRPAHVALFGCMAYLIAAQLHPSRRNWAWISTVALGIAIEVVQSSWFQSAFEWRDVRDDIFGVLIAFALYALSDRYHNAVLRRTRL
jgi:hypothetical protein